MSKEQEVYKREKKKRLINSKIQTLTNVDMHIKMTIRHNFLPMKYAKLFPVKKHSLEHVKS